MEFWTNPQNHRSGLSPSAAILKRALDIAGASAGLVLLSPILAATAFAIKLDSPGPVFYRGVRAGLHGKPFLDTKFRTMSVDADKGSPTTALNDSRVTRVGRVLRKYKIDELPQLYSVLVGRMSLVGPRPEVLKYAELYEGDEKLILTVKPGITDLASLEFIDLDQVVGEADPETYFREHVFKKKNALRVRYVREQSLRGDVEILARTISRVALRPLKKSSL